MEFEKEKWCLMNTYNNAFVELHRPMPMPCRNPLMKNNPKLLVYATRTIAIAQICSRGGKRSRLNPIHSVLNPS